MTSVMQQIAPYYLKASGLTEMPAFSKESEAGLRKLLQSMQKSDNKFEKSKSLKDETGKETKKSKSLKDETEKETKRGPVEEIKGPKQISEVKEISKLGEQSDEEKNFDIKISGWINKFQGLKEKFGTLTFGPDSKPLAYGWISRATYTQLVFAVGAKFHALCIDAMTNTNSFQKQFSKDYVKGLHEAGVIKTILALNNLESKVPEPLFTFVNRIKMEDGECVCRTQRGCKAHIYQVPEHVAYNMTLEKAGLHVLFETLVLRIQNFLWNISRPEGSVDKTYYNNLTVDDTNWHNNSMSSYGEKFVDGINEILKVYNSVNSIDSSAGDLTKAAYDNANIKKKDQHHSMKVTQTKTRASLPSKNAMPVLEDE
jgi:hypothetical protein